ncbi:MAG: division/cell wall cluster transcriptional repressor MraZ, partial [Betaproteobacteria bacterium]
MFRGVSHLALDSKGRLAVPAKHRDSLASESDGRVILTADPSHCLLVYPLTEWEPIQKRLMALSSFNDKIRGLQRLLVGHADDVELD